LRFAGVCVFGGWWDAFCLWSLVYLLKWCLIDACYPSEDAQLLSWPACPAACPPLAFTVFVRVNMAVMALMITLSASC